MKTTFILLLVFCLFTNTQNELGRGIVKVDIYQATEIKVFKNKGDKNPEKVIQLVKQGGEIVIKEKDYAKWLLPETIWLDYSQFLFWYTHVQGNWIEVVINSEAGIKKWILRSPTFEIIPWEKFLIEHTTAVVPLIKTEIKAEPNSNAKIIRQSTDKDCFEALEINGDWIKIKTNETLDCNEHARPIKSGWIKWRQNNRLTIEYYLTC